jgi:hypothetical protein
VIGIIYTIVAGAIGAVLIGYAYFFAARKIGVIDEWLTLPAIFGALVGTVAAQAALRIRMYRPIVVALIAVILSVGSYTARLYFQYVDDMNQRVQVQVDSHQSEDTARQIIFANLTQEYPPGGFVGYVQYFGTEGMQGFSNVSWGYTPYTKNGVAWYLMGIAIIIQTIVSFSVAYRSVQNA